MVRKEKKQSHQPKTLKNKHDSVAQRTQTFTHHIRELRMRLFWSVLVSVAVGSLVYYYHDFFIQIVMAPLHGQKLIYLTPAGGFSFIFMVTFYITMIFVLPFVLYQMYAFIRPAIPRHTSMLSLKVGLAAMLLMAAGAAFGYLYAVPGGLNFLNNFAADYITASLTADSYLTFVLGYVLGIGVLFELPLLLLFWHWIHPLTPKGLLNSERFVIVGAFVAAAILSPSPDALTQTIIAVPIIFVYQLGVVAVLVSIHKTKRLGEKTETVREAAQPMAEHITPSVAAPAPTFSVAPVQHKKTHSMDVMTRKPAVVSGTKKPTESKLGTRSASVRQELRVPRRARVISDFGPIRRSPIDTNR